MTFRTLLVLVLSGLLLLSSITALFVVRTGVGQAVVRLMESQIETSLDAITAQVESYFESAGRTLPLLSLGVMHRQGLIEDDERLGLLMADLLRFENNVSYLGYGDVNGRFVGVWRDDQKRLILNTSTSEPGSMQEWIVHEDGQLEPFFDTEIYTYDPRTRVWFEKGMATDGVVWTDAYEFVDGQSGITAALSWQPKGADQPAGVFMMDFLLKDISEFLAGLASHYDGDAFVLALNGEVIATPLGLNEPMSRQVLAENMKAMTADERLEVEHASLLRSFDLEGERFFIGLEKADIPGHLNCLSAVIVRRSQAFGWVNQISLRTTAAALTAIFISIVVGALVATHISRPLTEVAAQVEEIGEFRLDGNADHLSRIREVRLLQQAVEDLRRSVRSFSRFAPVELVRDIVQRGGEAQLGGVHREITVSFCDLAGFTTQAETMTPQQTVETLSDYFEKVTAAVLAQGGTIDKFIGDAVMALYNAPAEISDHPAASCRAALQAVQALRQPSSGGPHLHVRFGLHTGDAIVGNTGTRDRFNYTAIGDAVNLASRLEGLNKVFGTSIIASEAVKNQAGQFAWRLLDQVRVVGRNAPVLVYELLGTDPGQTPVEAYEAALKNYWAADFGTAASALEKILVTHPDDMPTRFLLKRVKELLARPHDAAWEGILKLSEK